jgi:hypothetical protein
MGMSGQGTTHSNRFIVFRRNSFVGANGINVCVVHPIPLYQVSLSCAALGSCLVNPPLPSLPLLCGAGVLPCQSPSTKSPSFVWRWGLALSIPLYQVSLSCAALGSCLVNPPLPSLPLLCGAGVLPCQSPSTKSPSFVWRWGLALSLPESCSCSCESIHNVYQLHEQFVYLCT